MGYWKGKKRSEETKRKISITKKEQWKNPEYAKKVSENHKGQIAWNKGTKGIMKSNRTSFRKGHHPNPKTEFKKGHKLTEEHKKKLKEIMKGGNSTSFKKGHSNSNKWLTMMKQRMGGENHPNFKGWKSREPYGIEFNNKLKEFIRKRDNFTCQECGYTQDRLGYKLHVHHIDYNKKNNNPYNLISLCRSCHMKTGFNRDNWINYYQQKINGGKDTYLENLKVSYSTT